VTDPPTLTALCRDCLWTGCAPRPGALRRCPVCASPRLLVHAELDTLAIAHLDCDAFYASVEKRDRPELAQTPVIVGGGRRGVVTTACYIARTYGVRSAMPMFKALKACPDAVVIRPDFAKYKYESQRIMAKLAALTPLIQPLSLDEAWLDLSGTRRLNGGAPAFVLARAQGEIERETGLGISIGLSCNKFLAKIASDLDKPRGFAVIGAAEAKAFLAPRPVGLLPGVGPAMVRRLETEGYRRIGDLAQADVKILVQALGTQGLHLSALARGEDSRPVDPDRARKSISAETTFDDDLQSLAALEDRLWPACEKVAARARTEQVAGRGVVLKLKTADFHQITRRRTLPAPTQTAKTLFAVSRELLAAETGARTFRLIGIGLTDLVDVSPDAAPDDLFGDGAGDGGETRARATERTLDALRARFGATAVVSGRNLKRDR
jgi:DNA polymerase-4